ncbi:hypothetical protein [Microseira sp. BLCC-F43]|jgi:hypothetical protein|uniref:hypothetical protein n=1 Tax=Microseira sp. BLCC-F43 TaxID=3153602 RepID=UPI0035B6ADFE
MVQTYEKLAELKHPSARQVYASAMAAKNKLAALQAFTGYKLPSSSILAMAKLTRQQQASYLMSEVLDYS